MSAASWVRHRVRRVHARSVSPARNTSVSLRSASFGSSARAESVMRRCAIRPMECCAGFSGTECGHQTTIGESGSSRPEISASVGRDALPQPRRTIISDAPVSPPRWISASSWSGSSGSWEMCTIMRLGCSWEARIAARIASREWPFSARTTRVRTRPLLRLPLAAARLLSSLLMAETVVLCRCEITGASKRGCHAQASRVLNADPTNRTRRVQA